MALLPHCATCTCVSHAEPRRHEIVVIAGGRDPDFMDVVSHVVRVVRVPDDMVVVSPRRAMDLVVADLSADLAPFLLPRLPFERHRQRATKVAVLRSQWKPRPRFVLRQPRGRSTRAGERRYRNTRARRLRRASA